MLETLEKQVEELKGVNQGLMTGNHPEYYFAMGTILWLLRSQKRQRRQHPLRQRHHKRLRRLSKLVMLN